MKCILHYRWSYLVQRYWYGQINERVNDKSRLCIAIQSGLRMCLNFQKLHKNLCFYALCLVFRLEYYKLSLKNQLNFVTCSIILKNTFACYSFIWKLNFIKIRLWIIFVNLVYKLKFLNFNPHKHLVCFCFKVLSLSVQRNFALTLKNRRRKHSF